jgi:hypothetical protein
VAARAERTLSLARRGARSAIIPAIPIAAPLERIHCANGPLADPAQIVISSRWTPNADRRRSLISPTVA